MAKLSQKELLDEGITSLISKGLKKSARAVGAIGGALKAASDAGIGAGVGDLIRGGKAGYEAEKLRQKTKDTELNDTIEELGYIKIGKERGQGDILVVNVADLEYNDKGEQEAGIKYSRPLILKWDKDSKSFSVVRSPRGEEKEKDKPEVKNEKSSQVDMLRQLTLLSD